MVLGETVTATVLRRSQGNLGRAASACMQGDRTSFEDFHVLDQTAALVAVFDGHLGDEAAAFCAERLPLHLAKAETASEWQEAFKACDAELRERLPQTEAGTTATVVRVKESSQDALELLVGSCGDCRAVLWQKESNTLLSTRDHRPSDVDERRRIEAAGGEVTKEDPDDPPRVDGVLSCSRALGSFELKQEALWPEDQKVSCLPDFHKWHATRGDWLILACDGIWDAASNEQVVDRVCRRATKGKDLGQVVEAMLQLCSSSLDNLTLVAIELGAVEPKDDTVTMNAGNFLTARREAVLAQYKSFGLRFGFSLEKNIPEQGRTMDDMEESFDFRSILDCFNGCWPKSATIARRLEKTLAVTAMTLQLQRDGRLGTLPVQRPQRVAGRTMSSVSQAAGGVENFDFRSIHLQNAPEFVRSSVLQMLAAGFP
ncbi:unnamed protein product [Effrenium voratum]|nr:unnamed protein product [Effrenium voratum]